MPVDMIIAQLGQKGYDISGAAAAVQSGDRQAQKAWLDTFEQNNPDVAEAIAASWTGNNQSGNGGPGMSTTPAGGQNQPSEKGFFDQLNEWLSHL
jgi:hypothetical protein